MTRRLTTSVNRWPIRGAFVISRGSRTESVTVTAVVSDGVHTGHGEGVPYPRYGESVESVTAEINAAAEAVAAGASREDLCGVMRPGAARAAVDGALWDLEAKQAGRRVWEILDQSMAPLATAYTLSLGSPESMAAAAAEAAAAGKPLLKLKLGGSGDLERVRAVRGGAPNAQLIVDANEAWTVDDYTALTPQLAALDVAMIEQPFPAGEDDMLRDLPRPIRICADESAHASDTVAGLIGKYDMINIKLDKTGGLTEALRTRDAAKAAGLQIMVGCMVGSSLAMAPALVVAQGADIVDLDGPLLLAQDRDPGLRYDGAVVHPPEPALWG